MSPFRPLLSSKVCGRFVIRFLFILCVLCVLCEISLFVGCRCEEVILPVPMMRSNRSSQPPLPMPWSNWQEYCGPSFVGSRVRSMWEQPVRELEEEHRLEAE